MLERSMPLIKGGSDSNAIPEEHALTPEQPAVDATEQISLEQSDVREKDSSDNSLPKPAEQNTGIVAEAWHAISEVFNDFMHICGEVLQKIGKIFAEIAKFSGGGLTWVLENVLKPALLTLVNIGAYFLDKILYGAPGLRKHLHDGVFSSEPPAAWKKFVEENAGWDIYNSTHPVLDNSIGGLCVGIGLLNILNHTLTSYLHLASNYSHMLGKHGVFGERHLHEDKRNDYVRYGFGALSMIGVVPTVLFTNLLDATLTFFKHLAISWFNNQRPYSHVLGKHGVFGERFSFVDKNGVVKHWRPQDDRLKRVKIPYGLCSIPFVAVSLLVTNTVDAVLSIFKHFFLSFGRNLRWSYNFLGKHGVLGERIPYKDDRHWFVRIAFGVVSFPFVFLAAAVTNLIDLAISFVKNFGHLLVHYLRPFAADFIANLGQSIVRNIRPFYHLLGESGVMGKSEAYQDDRPRGARIVYGTLTVIPVGVALLGANLADIFCAVVKNICRSWFRNQRPLCHVLGDNGVFGERYSYTDANGQVRHWKDERNWAAIIAYGAISCPLVLATTLFTNALDLTFSCIRELAKSWFRNQRPLWHLLGDNGLFGERYSYTDANGEVRRWKDERSWAQIITFGILSSPLVAVTALTTNIIDVIGTFCKNFCLSFARNLAPIYHLLGDTGIMGESSKYQDDRSKLAIYGYGAASGLFVLATAGITNLIDLIGAYFKHRKDTIYKPALIGTGIVAGVITAPPAFVIRKVLKGAYNAAIDPFKSDEPISVGKILKGVANFFTLGIFSAVKKVFKACTGYTDRFGFPGNESGEGKEVNYFQAVQDMFKQAINLAAHGEFPNVKDGKHHFRMIMRIFYGFRHKVEDVVKTFHDAYLRYAKVLEGVEVPKTDARYNMHSFFQSSQFKDAEETAERKLHAGDVTRQVEDYLMPSAAR